MPDPIPSPFHFDIVQGAAAYRDLRAVFDAILQEQFSVINVDVTTAASIVIGAIPNLMSLREQIVTELPRFDIARFDNLHKYAYAAWWAHVMNLPSSGSATDYDAQVEEANDLRTTLKIAAEPLAHRKFIDPTAFASIKSGTGLLDGASDLMALGTLFDANWSSIEHKTIVTRAEVDRALELSASLFAAISQRHPGSGSGGANAEMRLRAFTALDQTWGKLRAGVEYIRFEQGDAESFMPSIRPQAPRRRKGDEDTTPAKPEPGTTTTPGTATPPKDGPSVPASTGTPIGGSGGPFTR